MSTQAVRETRGGGVDVPLLLYFFFWYLGNYYYNISNKLALKAAGGSAGFPMTVSTTPTMTTTCFPRDHVP